MEKFNLERALAGEPVITRNGKEVTQLVYFKDVIHKDCVYGVIGNQIKNWCIDGKYFHDDPNEFGADLFMKPKENAIWVNVYKREDGSLFLGHEFNTEKEAIDDAKGERGFVKILRITDRPDKL
jgi:hypothetical protein